MIPGSLACKRVEIQSEKERGRHKRQSRSALGGREHSVSLYLYPSIRRNLYKEVGRIFRG